MADVVGFLERAGVDFDVLEDPDTARRLPRQDWDLLRRIAEELRTLQGRLEDEAEEVTRDRRVDHLLAEMEESAEATP